jgi:hypothetical protein
MSVGAPSLDTLGFTLYSAMAVVWSVKKRLM